MRKLLSMVCALSCVMVMLTGCGGTKEVSADVNALAGDLASKITYQEELAQMDLDTASMFINLSDVSITNSVFYENSGATVEEIIVLECASDADAAKALEAFKTRVSEQRESFENYVPEELKKLDKAVLATSGKYAVLSISDDPDTAKSVISEYLK